MTDDTDDDAHLERIRERERHRPMTEHAHAHGHGPIRDATMHMFGDDIPARECQRCGLKVATANAPDGFAEHSCDHIVRLEDADHLGPAE